MTQATQALTPWLGQDGRVSALRVVVLVALIYPAGWLGYWWLSGLWLVPQGELTYWSGVWALVVLLASLAVTPMMRILRWSRLGQVRRMIGVAAFLYTLAHLVFFAWLRFWNLGALVTETFTRLSLILATLSLIGLAALAATSFDEAIRRMGPRSWRRLHRTSYVLTALAVLHFILSPGSYGGQPYAALGAYLWLMGWRWLDGGGRGSQPAALGALTLACAAATAASEAVIPSLLLDTDPAATLSYNLSLVLGLAPAWKVLAIGGVLTALATVRGMTTPAQPAARGSRYE